MAIDPITGVPLNFGGRGMDRDFPHGVQILRSSYWENYDETNATAAYIDGVGTIHQDENGSGYPMVPDIRIFGVRRMQTIQLRFEKEIIRKILHGRLIIF